jgi:hypothetical protein
MVTIDFRRGACTQSGIAKEAAVSWFDRFSNLFRATRSTTSSKKSCSFTWTHA